MPHNNNSIMQTEKKVSEQCEISNIIIIMIQLYKDKVHNDYSLINFAQY